MRKLILLFLLFGLTTCVKKYDFNVLNGKPGIVIDASISNLSYTEILAIPSDGHYFKVLLQRTSDVDNVRDVKISDAKVYLKDDKGAEWNYTSTNNETGEYYLYNDDFKAKPNVKYQLNVDLIEGQHFESAWEAMPTFNNKMGEFTFDEVKPEKYKWEVGERVIKETYGLNVNINVPERNGSEKHHYRWTFEPLWMHTAIKTDTRSPIRTCWIRNSLYQKGFVLQEDPDGGYSKELFFIETKGNDRLFQYFSTLIYQDLITAGYHSFWVDLNAQKDKGGLFDQPPFGVSTNFTATNNDWTVNGYFGVVSRQVKRWTFEPKKLSYVIYNYLKELCDELGDPGDPDQCYDCRAYNAGEATTAEPDWWEKR